MFQLTKAARVCAVSVLLMLCGGMVQPLWSGAVESWLVSLDDAFGAFSAVYLTNADLAKLEEMLKEALTRLEGLLAGSVSSKDASEVLGFSPGAAAAAFLPAIFGAYLESSGRRSYSNRIKLWLDQLAETITLEAQKSGHSEFEITEKLSHKNLNDFFNMLRPREMREAIVKQLLDEFKKGYGPLKVRYDEAIENIVKQFEEVILKINNDPGCAKTGNEDSMGYVNRLIDEGPMKKLEELDFNRFVLHPVEKNFLQYAPKIEEQLKKLHAALEARYKSGK